MENKDQLVSAVMSALSALESDVNRRNRYMNDRHDALYEEGLFKGLDIETWFARYNYLPRVVDVHTSQLMGRPYSVYSYYSKEDLAPYEDDPDNKKLAIIRNKKRKANADTRRKALEAIRRDNGGHANDRKAAEIGVAYGTTAYKQWFDKKEKKVIRQVIESPQNLYIGWSDNDFRKKDFVAYVHQISLDSAYRQYGSHLGEDEDFTASIDGQPFGGADGKTDDPINTLHPTTTTTKQTDRKMATVIDLSGFVNGFGKDGASVKRGQEQEISLIIVGGKLIQVISDPKFIPKYYIINNKEQPRQAWGGSDITDSAMEINTEIIQMEYDSRRFLEKNLYNLVMAKGFTAASIPKKKARKQMVIPMTQEQSLEEMTMNLSIHSNMRSEIEAKMQAFVRVTGIGRVMFDDPTVDANSNQALMTTMKPILDATEDKQSRWERALIEMDTDALKLSAEFIPTLKEAVSDDEEEWYLCVEWPSVFRREDASFQTMWINQVQGGYISLETYHEKMGLDYSEEMDRMGDELNDKVPAAILARQLGLLAANLINPPTPSTPDIKYNVNVNAKTDADPEVNRAVVEEVLGGDAGAQAVDKMDAPQPDNTAPTLTTDQNSGQAVSQPGSGQPAISPEGAIAQANQNAGA